MQFTFETFILVPRAHDPSAGRDRELWPIPKYAQSQWMCIFVTVGNHYCFTNFA